MEKARTGDLDGAIDIVRAVADGAYESGDMIWRARATNVLVELLIRRGANGDQREAQAAIDRLAAVPTEPGFVLHELPLLRSRALLALARGDEDSCRSFMQRHRATAAATGFDALVATADATIIAPPAMTPRPSKS
jgi:adenylate cyclase